MNLNNFENTTKNTSSENGYTPYEIQTRKYIKIGVMQTTIISYIRII